MHDQLIGKDLILFDKMEPYYQNSIRDGFKLLLESKHLYQSVSIIPPEESVFDKNYKEFMAGTMPPSDFKVDYQQLSNRACLLSWNIISSDIPKGGYSILQEEKGIESLSITPPDVKLYCRNCKRIEAFNFQYGHTLLKEYTRNPNSTEESIEQVFALAYQCQSCKKSPEIFLVSRKNLKLTICGRTPIEIVDRPNFIPKEQADYFSDAVLAFDSGQILAGNFLLRTFIEQFVRSISKNPCSDDMDMIFSEYNDKLPTFFKEQMPSLKAIYGKLSDDIHGAAGSADLFEQSKSDIIQYFDAMRVHKINL